MSSYYCGIFFLNLKNIFLLGSFLFICLLIFQNKRYQDCSYPTLEFIQEFYQKVYEDFKQEV